MRHIGLLAVRLVLGSYLTVHGFKKLFRYFGGSGLDATARGFEAIGVEPARAMATVAGASQLGGGLLTLAGVADPLGPALLAGNMAVAAVALRKNGPMSQRGGYELPLTNLAAAVALMSSGAGVLRLGPPLSKSLIRIILFAGTAMTIGSLVQLLRRRPTTPCERNKMQTESTSECGINHEI